MAVPVSELQKINPSSIIELFELEINAAVHGADFTYRFHAGTSPYNSNGNVVWDGNTYSALPIEAEGFEYKAETGSLPRPRIRVANLLGSITAILLDVNTTTAGNDLTGAKLTRIRTLLRYLDDANFPDESSNPFGTADATSKFPDEIYYVARKVTETRDMVEFELAAAFDLAGVRAPKRQCSANLCPWIYKGSECGYSGSSYFDENDKAVTDVADDVCGKKLSSCQARFGATAELPFGAFPGIGAFNT
jgi:lambda family phage minor tail protein L